MLTRLEIKNFAIIDQVALDLSPGLNIFVVDPKVWTPGILKVQSIQKGRQDVQASQFLAGIQSPGCPGTVVGHEK